MSDKMDDKCDKYLALKPICKHPWFEWVGDTPKEVIQICGTCKKTKTEANTETGDVAVTWRLWTTAETSQPPIFLGNLVLDNFQRNSAENKSIVIYYFKLKMRKLNLLKFALAIETSIQQLESRITTPLKVADKTYIWIDDPDPVAELICRTPVDTYDFKRYLSEMLNNGADARGF